MKNEGNELSLTARVESVLFVAEEPISAHRLAEALGVASRQIEEALRELASHYDGRGVRLQHHDQRVQLTTAPEAAPTIERFLGLEARMHLSQAALEALAIIAYRQPATRSLIEAIRGVGSDSVLRTLLSAGLIERTGRADAVGRPFLYGTTPEFLQHFGLESLDELPELEDDAQGSLETMTPR
ncbi:MAG: SMC-Scp complex subunit ScpB [Anaerolineae bacterium]